MRSHNLISHTADARLRVEADTREELFRAALEGMNELIKNGFCKHRKGYPVREEILLTAGDTTALLIDFLSDVLTLSHQNQALFCAVDFLEFTETTLRAIIHGAKTEDFEEDVKAVTYHEVEVKKNEAGNYETLIVFDI